MNRLTRFIRAIFQRRTIYLQVGALALREGPSGREVLMISSRGRGVWLLPKGWPMKNKTLPQSAATEAWEEAGLRGTISEEPCGQYLYHKTREAGFGQWCEVLIYPITDVTLAEDYPEKGLRERRWIGLAQACAEAGEPELRKFLKSL